MKLFLYLQGAQAYAKISEESERLQLFSKRLMDIWSKAQDKWSQQASANQ
jgi:hypothetical protein